VCPEITGAGKRPMTKLIAGFYQPQAGVGFRRIEPSTIRRFQRFGATTLGATIPSGRPHLFYGHP